MKDKLSVMLNRILLCDLRLLEKLNSICPEFEEWRKIFLGSRKTESPNLMDNTKDIEWKSREKVEGPREPKSSSLCDEDIDSESNDDVTANTSDAAQSPLPPLPGANSHR